MIRTAQALEHFLKRNDIDPVDVTVVLRVNDDMLLEKLLAVVQREFLDLIFTTGESLFEKPKSARICGILIKFASLDRSG